MLKSNLKRLGFGVLLATAAAVATTTTASAQNKRYYSGGNDVYQVTITNLTYNQVFSPPLAASHTRRISLFTAGEAASAGIAEMAESGSVATLVASVDGNRNVRGAGVAGGPVLPGQSVTIEVPVNRGRVVSAVSMLVNTNDAFLGLNSVRGPRYRGFSATYDVIAYDAGSEPNDQLCANIPGPACGGAGLSADAGGEGFIHVHRGVHTGIGDLDASIYDWRNPVARVTIKRTRPTPPASAE